MVENFTRLAARHDSQFVNLPEVFVTKLAPYMLSGENIEISLRSWGLTHIEGSNANVKGRKQGRQYGHAWLIITNARLMIASRGPLSFEVRSFQFNQISSIEIQEGVIDDVLMISGLGVREIWVFRRKVRPLVKAISVVIQNRISKNGTTGIPNIHEDPLGTLKLRLARGEISEKEFENLRNLL